MPPPAFAKATAGPQSASAQRKPQAPSHRTTELPNYRTTELPNYRTTELPNYRTTELPNYRTTELPSYRATELPTTRHMSDFASDLRHSLRRMRAAPSFTAVAVLTLALGIGATTAIYSVIDAL